MDDPGGDMLTTVIAGLAALVAAVASSVTTLIVSRKPAIAAATTADAAWVTAMAAGFKELTAAQERREKALMAQVSRLENAVNGLSQHVYTLEDILRDSGLPIPERPDPAHWSPPDMHALNGAKT